MDKRRRSVKPKKKRKLIFLILLLFLGLCTLVFISKSSYFEINEIYIQGNKEVTDEKIVEIVKKYNDNYWLLDEQELKQAVSDHYWIYNVDNIQKEFPDQLYIEVSERSPRGITSKNGRYYLLSSDLIVLKEVEGYNHRLPYISGLEIPSEIEVGTNLGGDISSDVAEMLRMMPQVQSGLISEINLDLEKNEINLYTREGTFVKLGELTKLEEKLTALDKLSEKLPGENSQYYLDLRVPQYPVLVDKHSKN